MIFFFSHLHFILFIAQYTDQTYKNNHYSWPVSHTQIHAFHACLPCLKQILFFVQKIHLHLTPNQSASTPPDTRKYGLPRWTWIHRNGWSSLLMSCNPLAIIQILKSYVYMLRAYTFNKTNHVSFKNSISLLKVACKIKKYTVYQR